THVHKRGHGHQDDLEHPEPYMREGSKGIVADVLTARLPRVADELALFVIVDGFSPHCGEDDTKDNEHGEPQLPHECGVVVDLLQQPREEAPAHGISCFKHSISG
uniref:Uncharacterized protein n=1 Tax=Cynoglossus semilaevis TaxID=244447 RepID=A0A3P8VQR7_CYNSE